MTALEFIGLLVAGFIVSGFTLGVSMQFAQPAKLRKNSTRLHLLTPFWVILIEVVIIITAGFLLHNGFWLACGTWFGAAVVVGLLTEAIAWKLTSKKKTDRWMQAAAAKDRIMDKELCKQTSHQWDTWHETENVCVLVRSCTRCGEEENRDSGKHSWGEWKAGEKPCQQVHACTICGKEKEEYVHDFRIVKEWIDHTRVDTLPDGRHSGKYYLMTQEKCKRCRKEQTTQRLDYVVHPEE